MVRDTPLRLAPLAQAGVRRRAAQEASAEEGEGQGDEVQAIVAFWEPPLRGGLSAALLALPQPGRSVSRFGSSVFDTNSVLYK